MKLRIVGDGTFHGTRIEDESGQHIPGVVRAAFTLAMDRPVAMVDLTLYRPAIDLPARLRRLHYMVMPRYLNDDKTDLLITREQLTTIADLLPPDVEMRVGSILTAARFPTVVVPLGDQPYEFNERDMEHITVAIKEKLGVEL